MDFFLPMLSMYTDFGIKVQLEKSILMEIGTNRRETYLYSKILPSTLGTKMKQGGT